MKKTTSITVPLPANLAARLAAASKALGLTPADLIRVAIANGVKEVQKHGSLTVSG